MLTVSLRQAVRAAVEWFEHTAIHGKIYARGRAELQEGAEGTQIWARFYEIGTGRPIFGDRDKSIHDALGEISDERRRGYSWYNDVPAHALDRYKEWSRKR